jgi:hypothetical protein
MMEKLGARAASPEEFRCFVCSHVFNNPLFLQCGHFACFRCVKATNLFKNNSCPVCLDEFKFDHENLQVYHLLKILQETRFTGPGPVGTWSDSAPKGASRDGSDDDCFAGSSPKPVARCTLASPCNQCSSSCPVSPNLIRGGLACRSFDLDPSASFSLETEASDQVKNKLFRKFGDHPFWQEQGRSSNESSPRQGGDSSANNNIDKYDPFSSSLVDILSPTALMRTSSAFVHDFDFEAYRRAVTMWKFATVVAIIGAIFGISLAAFPGIRHGVANLMGLEYVGDGHCREGEWGYMGESECQMEDELGKLQEERKKWLMKTLDRIVQK